MLILRSAGNSVGREECSCRTFPGDGSSVLDRPARATPFQHITDQNIDAKLEGLNVVLGLPRRFCTKPVTTSLLRQIKLKGTVSHGRLHKKRAYRSCNDSEQRFHRTGWLTCIICVYIFPEQRRESKKCVTSRVCKPWPVFGSNAENKCLILLAIKCVAAPTQLPIYGNFRDTTGVGRYSHLKLQEHPDHPKQKPC